MPMEWALKSESDLDRVYVALDDDGNETDEYVYAFADGRVERIGPEGSLPPVIPPAVQQWWDASVPYDWKSDPVQEIEQDDAFLDRLDLVRVPWRPVLWWAVMTVWMVVVVLSLHALGV